MRSAVVPKGRIAPSTRSVAAPCVFGPDAVRSVFASACPMATVQAAAARTARVLPPRSGANRRSRAGRSATAGETMSTAAVRGRSADISLDPATQILVCASRCTTDADCTSGCCTTFQSGDKLCDRSIACGGAQGTCTQVTPEPADAMSDVAPAPAVTEFAVGTNPYRITSGPDGNLWFTYYQGVARITVTGTLTNFPLTLPSGAQPGGIAAGADGTSGSRRGARARSAGSLRRAC